MDDVTILEAEEVWRNGSVIVHGVLITDRRWVLLQERAINI